MIYHESWVERQIREATERGEFDHLPGSGKPLDLGDPDDPDWWLKRKLAREGLELSGAAPAVLLLRREAAGYPESLLDVASEEHVREILRDYNRRVVEDRLRPTIGRAMPAVAPRLDVEEMVARWRDLRAERPARRAVTQAVGAAASTTGPPGPEAGNVSAQRPWWRRWRRDRPPATEPGEPPAADPAADRTVSTTPGEPAGRPPAVGRRSPAAKADPLVRLGAGNGPARWRLVGCPPSGAGATYYRPLAREGLELWSVRYPGRESRFTEPFAASLAEIAEEVSASLGPVLAGDHLPTVLLGHSMGGGVAAEIAARLDRASPGRLGLLALSARAAPEVARRDEAQVRALTSDDAALRAWLTDLGGTPRELLDDPDFMAMQLPILRADLLASNAYDRSPRGLHAPLLLLCGNGDPVIGPAEMSGWAAMTGGEVTEQRLDGGHDAILTDADTALDAMTRLLRL